MSNIPNDLDDFLKRGQTAQRAVDHVLLLTNIRANLHRWRSRYAASEHARQHVKETSLLIAQIDEWLSTRKGNNK
jgi:hypothetical protein